MESFHWKLQTSENRNKPCDPIDLADSWGVKVAYVPATNRA